MIDYKKLDEIIAVYKERFVEIFKGGEGYKWRAVQHFQKHWNVDAKDFGAMFKEATRRTDNLLASRNNFPKAMIEEFCNVDQEAVRQMFKVLYDEDRGLAERIQYFMDESERLRLTYGAEINITGGTFDVSFSGGNNAVIELRAGFLNISGGTFKYTEDFDPEKPYINSLDTKLNTNGAGNYIGTIVVSKPTSANITSGYASPAIVNITGGTFINNEGKDAIVMANHSSKQVDDGTGEFRDNHDIIVNLDGVSMQIDGEINKYDKADSRESKFYDNRPQQP